MARRRLIEPRRLVEFFDKVAPELYRYPAIDPPAFRRTLEWLVADLQR